jgi:hypothetical protein
LVDQRVDFVIVGGVAGTLAGSPLVTNDLDIVYATDTPNLARLVQLLHDIGAHYRDPAGRRIRPDAEKLSRFKVNLLHTTLGRLDLLREIGDGWDFAELVDRSIKYQLEESTVLAIDLRTLIDAKSMAGRTKDLHALPFLRRLLELEDRK